MRRFSKNLLVDKFSPDAHSGESTMPGLALRSYLFKTGQ